MSKVIYIKANAKPEGASRTFRISDSFVESYRESHPNDEIIVLDLYKENMGFLTEEDVALHNVKPGEGKNYPVLKYAYQFLEADKFIISAPFWNLSFPAILKAYLDYVTVSGITFKYTSQGPVGLCEGKKAIHFVTRGGAYSQEPLSDFELGDRYLRTLLGFLGIRDFTTFAREDMDRSDTNVELVVSDAIKEAQELAKNF
ncbi:FMN-dependent NADH-azoreductase AzoR [Gottschalkia acidurici 9a]|uniref:FMN dependent NADH:quinone oxidoreductase n=1 Tax=Gottschalkia acidurici (strain ATCC 7906 / DSM 604 / BCRC 14475 / CIP 104303 / KCTC 5404 / NCIMB 10678 / 9a) TaxID=1128398 RepID=K0B5D0_GOTA9|nr:FMN-dependent NADH-azoreductase [Gottschalkia acidurici]AFS79751.1 FMN-dependent NADH-azoreductase AzoR [Gottschalkia acidurici 9a]